jgi:hypothetical protein
MLDMLMPLFPIKDEYVLLTSQALFYQLVQNNQTFSATLSHNNDARRRFQELLQRLNFKYWNKCPKQNFDAQYHESGDLLNNTTLAESFEYKSDPICSETLILNFPKSKYDSLKMLTIEKIIEGVSSSLSIDSCCDASGYFNFFYENNLNMPTLKVFKHNPKHHINLPLESRISKFDVSASEAQKLLDDSRSPEGGYSKKMYSYSKTHGKFVIFRRHSHELLEYHGYWEEDTSKIPMQVIQHYIS